MALGGYGRGELAPASDVDLLILHRGDRPAEVAAVAERLLYPLWDAGLTVGHAVRTAEECLALAEERLDARTALLDGRDLEGDRSAWGAVHTELARRLRADPRTFAERLRDDAAERRRRHGAVSQLLEPELKEGAGGLRDLDALGWLDVALGGERGGLDRLVELELLREAERRSIDDARGFLVRVRSAVHLATGRADDRLVLERQPSVALDLGFVDESGSVAVDALMRSLLEHARQVEHVHGAVFDRFLLGTAEAPEVEPTPAGVLRALAEAAEVSRIVPPAMLDRIEAIDVADPVPWDGEVRDAFLRLLLAGAEGVRALETLDRLGLLQRYLPAWAEVRCRPQRDPYHRSAVDVHLLDTLDEMGTLLREGRAEDPVANEAVALVHPREDALLLGALLHDIGKTGRGDHVPRGVEIARTEIERMGLEPADAELVAFLVSEHLLLPDTATRRDLQDADLVADVAAIVGDPVRLAALYLLSLADAEATGPLAATPWRAALVRELVAKVHRVLERGDVGADTADRLAERIAQLRLRVEEADVLEAFLRRVPGSYLLTVPTEQALEHLRMLAAPIGATEVRTLERASTSPGAHAVTVIVADRPGLLAMIAGALTLAGVSILAAQAFTTEDGIALDVFDVVGTFEAEIGEDRWRSFRSTLRRAIEGRISLDHGVAEKRHRYPPPRVEFPTDVRVDNDASDFFTVIEVGAADRIGLLFDITRTFAELGLDVHIAKVATYGDRVVDAFYLRDEVGRKLEDPARVDALERALRTRIAAS